MLEAITACFYPTDQHSKKLVADLAAQGIKTTVYGIGKNFFSFVNAKITSLIPKLERMKSEYVLYVDCADVFVQGQVEEAFFKVLGSKDVLIAGDHRCWPHKEMKKEFLDVAPKGTLFPYICAGVFGGKRDAVISALNEMDEYEPDYWLAGDDQERWMRWLDHGWLDSTSIDYNADLVVSLSGYRSSWFKSKKKPMQLKSGIVPALAHFNGDNPKKTILREYLA